MDEKITFASFFLKFQLKKAAKQTETVKHFRLNNDIQEPKAATNCLVAGWGKTNVSSKKMSDVLMSVNVTIIDRVKCNSPEYYNCNPVITSGMICAGSVSKKEADTCQVRRGGTTTCQHLFDSRVFANDTCVFSLPGGFRRPSDLQWSTGRSHVFWEEMRRREEARCVLLRLQKPAPLDPEDYEEVRNIIGVPCQTFWSLHFNQIRFCISLILHKLYSDKTSRQLA